VTVVIMLAAVLVAVMIRRILEEQAVQVAVVQDQHQTIRQVTPVQLILAVAQQVVML
jgi:hypothetical protein